MPRSQKLLRDLGQCVRVALSSLTLLRPFRFKTEVVVFFSVSRSRRCLLNGM